MLNKNNACISQYLIINPCDVFVNIVVVFVTVKTKEFLNCRVHKMLGHALK
jgi:hypothetical protein